jgi:hypothetical protein
MTENFRPDAFSADSNEEKPAESFRTCRCGFHKHDLHVVPHCKYKWHAILRLLLGATAYPWQVRYVCERCGETIETTSDIEVLKTHV